MHQEDPANVVYVRSTALSTAEYSSKMELAVAVKSSSSNDGGQATTAMLLPKLASSDGEFHRELATSATNKVLESRVVT